MSSLNWECILDRTVTGVARVFVWDRREASAKHGRYIIHKTMKTRNGQVRTMVSYRFQKPAALRHVEKWLKGREKIIAEANAGGAQ